MRIAAYTGGLSDPSARVRIRQYIPRFAHHGLLVSEYPLPYGNQRPKESLEFVAWGTITVAYRIATLAAGHFQHVSWVCRQFLPANIGLTLMARKPIVLDVDDAIWLNRGGVGVESLARASACVICGNHFLACRFREWNPNVTVIPSGIDTSLFRTDRSLIPDSAEVVIGWTGTSGNFRFLYSLERPLRDILASHKHVRLLIVADRVPSLPTLPSDKVEFVRWSPEAERHALSKMSIGIMPIDDSDWSRGKCAYKMLFYMANGLPVVVSPYGVNAEILQMAHVGFGSITQSDWVDALDCLISDPVLRMKLGEAGRRLVREHYNVNTLASSYIEVFKSVISHR